ncbi:MAG TPA: hypothetical protein VGJ15_10335 [Pirellulales bacterium]
MGTSFVTVDGDHGFWMGDGILDVWLRFLALHLPEPKRTDDASSRQVFQKIRDQFLLASKGWFIGCVPHGLEEAIATPVGERIIRAGIDSLLSALKKAPPTLGREVLNLIGISVTFFRDYETWRLVEVGNAFLDLLDRKINSDASSTAFMPGSGQTEER